MSLELSPRCKRSTDRGVNLITEWMVSLKILETYFKTSVSQPIQWLMDIYKYAYAYIYVYIHIIQSFIREILKYVDGKFLHSNLCLWYSNTFLVTF